MSPVPVTSEGIEGSGITSEGIAKGKGGGITSEGIARGVTSEGIGGGVTSEGIGTGKGSGIPSEGITEGIAKGIAKGKGQGKGQGLTPWGRSPQARSPWHARNLCGTGPAKRGREACDLRSHPGRVLRQQGVGEE